MSRRCWTRTSKAFAAELLAALTLPLAPAGAQTLPEQYRVYTDAPRLLLRPQRLRLLRRERERQSPRWIQFSALIGGGAPMPEPGFAEALVFAVSGDKAAGRNAIDWALHDSKDVWQGALVLDWCREVLSDAERKAIAARLVNRLSADGRNVAAVRDRVFVAMAIADYDPDASARMLQSVIEDWWRGQIVPGLRSGEIRLTQAELYPLFEIVHAIRDNLNIDLREDAPRYFKPLPLWYVASFYPAPYEGAANEYRIPSWTGSGEPDLKGAALARAAGLALVASDTNATETQYAQGLLMQDRFLMRDPFGAPYEFLWANPYQPGLAYSLLPLVFYDERGGALFVRSSWDEDARWFGIVGGEFQLFEDGRVRVLTMGAASGAPKPLEVGSAEVVQWRVPMRLDAGAETLFVVGGKAGAKYNVEIEDEEMQESEADRVGTVRLDLPKDRHPRVYLSAAR